MTLTSKTRPRLSHITYAYILREMLAGPSTTADLVEVTGIRVQSIRQIVNTLHRLRVIHIARWDKAHHMNTAAYAIGDEPDVPRPKRLKNSVVTKRYRARKKVIAMHAVMTATPEVSHGQRV